MKDKYFRIIELPEYEVLLQKDWDEETDSPTLAVIFYTEGVMVNQKLGYATEEQRDKAFLEVTSEQAQTMVDAVLKIIE